jgi:uncharacterized membrane protein YkvA (DUF1232 family)
MQINEPRLWKKIGRYARQAGIKTVYAVLLMYYAFRRKETPRWAKSIIVGTLGYFLSPIDGIPDLTPVIGYTDDLGVLMFGLVSIAAFINQDVRELARHRLKVWFGEFDGAPLAEVDSKL